MDIRIQLDTKQFEDAMNKSAAEIVRGLRSAVNSSARAARKEFLSKAAQDIGVTKAAVTRYTTFKPAGSYNLTATLVARKGRISPLDVGGVFDKQGGRLDFKTLRLSGGNVASPLTRAFTLRGGDGKPVVLIRQSSARGLGAHSLKNTKRIYVEHVASALGIERLVPRKSWEKTANAEIAKTLEANVQAALDGRSVPEDSGYGG